MAYFKPHSAALTHMQKYTWSFLYFFKIIYLSTHNPIPRFCVPLAFYFYFLMFCFVAFDLFYS